MDGVVSILSVGGLTIEQTRATVLGRPEHRGHFA